MKRALLTTMFTLLLAGLTAPTASAQSPHYKPKGGPTCSINQGATFEVVTCTGTVSGLGNFDVLVTLSGVSGTGNTECVSPGGNTAPGQNPGEIATSGAVFIPASQIKNGSLTFSVSTTIPTVTSAQAGCPNPNWTANLLNFDITSTSGQLVVNQIINGVTTPVITSPVTF